MLERTFAVIKASCHQLSNSCVLQHLNPGSSSYLLYRHRPRVPAFYLIHSVPKRVSLQPAFLDERINIETLLNNAGFDTIKGPCSRPPTFDASSHGLNVASLS